MFKSLLLLTVLLTFTGCSYSRKIATIGDKEYYKVQATSFLGPTINMIVTKPVTNCESRIEQAFAGNGFVPAIVGSGGIMGGAVLLGNAIKPNNTIVNQQQSDKGNSVVNSVSTATQIIEDSNTPAGHNRPPNNRPPTNRPPNK